jgi:hypothetical protein
VSEELLYVSRGKSSVFILDKWYTEVSDECLGAYVPKSFDSAVRILD